MFGFVSNEKIKEKTYIVLMFYHQIVESIREKNLSNIYKERIFKDRLLIPVEMDLTVEIHFCGDQHPKYDFREIKLADLQEDGWKFVLKSRYYAAIRKLKKGFRCFAITHERKIVGDVWCTKVADDGTPTQHDDAYKTGLYCQDWEAYAFNMTIAPSYRDMQFAVFLHRYLQATLKKEGYSKIYGFYWKDNVSALWTHRLLRFKEHPKRKITRVLMYSNIEDYDLDELSSKPTEQLPLIAEFCWEHFNCFEETRKTCLAYIQSESECWELFLEDGELRQNCKVCKYRVAKLEAS
jgi:hypothetical protein